MDRDDDATMALVAAGDEAAMAGFVGRWQGPVQSYARRFLACSADEAADLAQDAFLRVWTARERWRPDTRVSAWLFTIVANLCRNRRRSILRRPTLVALDPVAPSELDDAAPAATDPYQEATAAELAAILHRALGELPEHQRAALLLRQVEGLSYQDIAAVLGVSASAVDALLSRARRSLAKKIAG